MFSQSLTAALVFVICCSVPCLSAVLASTGCQHDEEWPSFSKIEPSDDNVDVSSCSSRSSSLAALLQMNIFCLDTVFPTPVWPSPFALVDQERNQKRDIGNRGTRTIPRDDGASDDLDLSPTPAPTGTPSTTITVHITNQNEFALLLPNTQGELVSDAEGDGVSFCTTSSSDATCVDRPRMSDGFIRAAAVKEADDGSWIQVTGCIDPSKSTLDPSDDGGQLDVRYPNGAQCTFGGYGASFIEQIEPSASRFCLRCCASPNDQEHCNSHQDTAGCPVVIPGQYDFPDIGVSCS